MRLTAMLAFTCAALLALAASAGADGVVKHSGSIVAIADDARTFVLAEVGPWQVRNGATVVTRRTITLIPETQFAMVGRVDDAPSGFPGDFIEVALGPESVYLYDYVTVECRYEGTRALALKITVADLATAGNGEGTPGQ
jgi:hypothetical protein